MDILNNKYNEIALQFIHLNIQIDEEYMKNIEILYQILDKDCKGYLEWQELVYFFFMENSSFEYNRENFKVFVERIGGSSEKFQFELNRVPLRSFKNYFLINQRTKDYLKDKKKNYESISSFEALYHYAPHCKLSDVILKSINSLLKDLGNRKIDPVLSFCYILYQIIFMSLSPLYFSNISQPHNC